MSTILFIGSQHYCKDRQQKLEELCQSIDREHESEVMIATKRTGLCHIMIVNCNNRELKHQTFLRS